MVSRDAVLAKARGWLDEREDPDGSNNVVFSRDWGIVGQSWCFAFVQSCFWYADPSPSGKLPHQSMYCPYGIQWARDNGQAIEVGQGDPLPGDVVFFSWDMATWPRWRAGTGDHVGIVERYEGGDTVYTIEGNIGSPQGVWRKERSISGTVVCFWRPTVYDDDSFGPAALPEDDMFEQADRDRLAQAAASVQNFAVLMQEIRNYAGGAHDQGVAANVRLDQMREEFEALADKVKALPVDGSMQPAEGPNVEAVLRQATPEQLSTLPVQTLFAALSAAFSAQQHPAA